MTYETVPYGQTIGNEQHYAYQREGSWGQDPTETWAPGFQRTRTYSPRTWTAQDEELLQEQQEDEFDGIFSVIYEYCVKPLADGLSDGVDFVMNKAIEVDEDSYYHVINPNICGVCGSEFAAGAILCTRCGARRPQLEPPGGYMYPSSLVRSTSQLFSTPPPSGGQIPAVPGSRLVQRDELLRTGALCTSDEGRAGSLVHPPQTLPVQTVKPYHTQVSMQTVQPYHTQISMQTVKPYQTQISMQTVEAAAEPMKPLPVKWAKVL